MSKKIIFFELNEIPKRIFDHFCEAYPRSATASLRDRASFFSTATDGSRLHPWVTWPTLHRGVSGDTHTITHLNQDLQEIDKAYPPLWSLLAKNASGGSVGVAGSLHSFPIPQEGKYAFYLPDTFAAKPDAFPAELQAFQDFNLAMVAKSARNVHMGIDLSKAKGLLPHLHKLNLSPRTVAVVASQLVAERIDERKKLRRRTLQSMLAFDGYMGQVERTRPEFSTFFTNHLASSMHRFWAAMYPDDYDDFGYDDAWVKSFGTEITTAMREADHMIGVLKKFVEKNPEYILIVGGSMGQAAHRGEPHITELTMVDVDRFMKVMNVPAKAWTRRPAMMPDYSFFVEKDARSAFLSRLAHARIGQKDLPVEYEERENGFVHVCLGTPNLDEERDTLRVGNETFTLSEAGLHPLPTDFQQGSTGYHIPEGILLVYDPELSGQTHTQSVCITDIAPSILRKLNAPVPGYMSSANIFN